MKLLQLRKFSLACLLSLFLAGSLNAQNLQSTAQKIRSYKNISYTDIIGIKFHFQDEISMDTVNTQLLLAAKEPAGGGYFKVKSNTNSYAYDGNKLVNLNFTDSTYKIEKVDESGQYSRTLLYWARNMEQLVQSPAKVRQLQDTVINGINCTNIKVIVSDTIIDNKPKYEVTNFIIDKKSNLPVYIVRDMKGNANDGSYFQFTETHSYGDYKFNVKTLPDLSRAIIPPYFRVPVKRVPVVFLANGTTAPSIKAADMDGNAFDLEKLKGKLVLVNFSLIGCPHCVGAAQMLNRLHEKYRDKGLVIVNIYPIDKKEAIIKFDTKENVKTPSYTSERAVQQVYPFDGYPSFYLLDKKGRVAQSYNGFYKELEAELTQMIESIDK